VNTHVPETLLLSGCHRNIDSPTDCGASGGQTLRVDVVVTYIHNRLPLPRNQELLRLWMVNHLGVQLMARLGRYLEVRSNQAPI